MKSATGESEPWSVLAHLCGLLFPPLSLIGTVAIWQTAGRTSARVRDQAVEATNFQISILIYMAVSGLAIMVLVGWLLFPLACAFNVFAVIFAAVAASRGKQVRYPFCIRLLR